MSEHKAELTQVRERLRRPPCWGPNEHGDLMVDMTVDSYERDLDNLAEAARRQPTPQTVTEASRSDFVLDGSPQHRAMVEVAVLRNLARKCHNGAPDPYQEFYDLGLSPLLDRLADALEVRNA